MATSDIAIKKAKPREKQYKITDEKGMYCVITPSGGKLWRLDYRFNGKRKTLSLGKYPEISLQDAREDRDKARKQIAKGIDPSEIKKIDKVADAGKDTFEAIAREWHTRNTAKWANSHTVTIIARLEQNLFPYVGTMKMNEITPPVLLATLRRIENRGAVETAHRVKGIAGQVFRYAIATGRAERDPTPDLKGALTPVTTQHHATITDTRKVGELLRAIDGFTGTLVVKCALLLTPLVFLRPGELRHGVWSEINLEEKQWRIPEDKMKKRRKHIIPLSDQAIAILEDIKQLTDRGPDSFIFPGIRDRKRPMSENTVNAALRRLGYTKEDMTAHGFRSMASTILHEQGWNTDIIELQLAHVEKNKVKAAYNHAQHIEERTRMMQSWANYLDGLQRDKENHVVSINKA
ncbi:MAG TPA: tyrosine-type recombinase/integrase [Gammaproteobacteria bacterium]|jgi:integrase|nr:tyrosine-type recombinase/integrase [Gammaproteobacteria bacterium]MBT3490403.1 tyrosine-type recombinase/integrase [Gammaproteobacteria bacterium]MBT3718131.1 tyrosine-type recombinase/integrase [Gammaproteobacteria bacterium]MBT3845555.1 tyrosine-type recombinase/integrase [Gammaproteobacteria bacterium]MBT3893293.1 tyrosine-type recombinase/integrase [Gammaproteobacteria bacterium]